MSALIWGESRLSGIYKAALFECLVAFQYSNAAVMSSVARLHLGMLYTASVFQLCGRMAHSFLAQSVQRFSQVCCMTFGTSRILSFKACCADDLLYLHDGDLDELGSVLWSLFSPTVAQYLSAAATKDAIPVPAVQDVPASGLGSLVVSHDPNHIVSYLPCLYNPQKIGFYPVLLLYMDTTQYQMLYYITRH